MTGSEDTTQAHKENQPHFLRAFITESVNDAEQAFSPPQTQRGASQTTSGPLPPPSSPRPPRTARLFVGPHH